MEFYRNIIYRAPVGFGMPDAGRFPSTYYNNIVIDALIPVLNDDYIDMNWLVGPDAPSREVILGESSASKGAGSYFVTDIYKTAWRYVYPEFYDFFDYYLNKKSNLTEQMSKVNNNLFVNISVPAIRPEPDRPYSQATPLPPDSLVVSDPLYGSYGNNRYLTHDPGFASYQTGDVQLSKAAAEDLGIEWIDVSAIGARRATSTPANDNESDNVGDNVSDSIASSNGGSSNGGSSSELPAVGDSLPYLFFAFSLLLCSGCLLIGRATQLRRAPRRLTKIRQRQA
jgi:hypothetical protein